MTLFVEQKLDTEIQISRGDAFGTFSMRVRTKDGGDAIITLDMESTIFVLENLDEGEEVFRKKRHNWFALFLGRFKKKGTR